MEEDAFRKRLERFYRMYNPSCLSSVGVICQTYRGREEDIFRVLTDKYGPEPKILEHEEKQLKSLEFDFASSSEALSTHVRGLNLHSCPQVSTGSQNKSEAYQGRGVDSTMTTETKNASELTESHGALKANSGNLKNGNSRERLIEFYYLHNPSMIPFVDELIQNYSGNEEKMFEDLSQRYTLMNEKKGSDTAFSLTDIDAVVKRLSVALEVKTAETLALKKDKEHLVNELARLNKLLEESKDNEQLLRQQLFAAKEDFGEGHAFNTLDSQKLDIVTAKKEREQLTRELDLSNKFLERIHKENKILKTKLLAMEEELRAKENAVTKYASQMAEREVRESGLRAELQEVKKECSSVRLSCTKLEHRTRVLEVEKQQLLEEVKEAEKRAFDIGELLSTEQQKNLSLIEEIGGLRLAVERPSTEAAFACIVKDIEGRLLEHYESEIKRHKKEMNEYYLYAENQLHRRDALIAELTGSQ